MGKSEQMYDQILDDLRQAYDGEAKGREAREIVAWKIAERERFLSLLPPSAAMPRMPPLRHRPLVRPPHRQQLRRRSACRGPRSCRPPPNPRSPLPQPSPQSRLPRRSLRNRPRPATRGRADAGIMRTVTGAMPGGTHSRSTGRISITTASTGAGFPGSASSAQVRRVAPRTGDAPA